VLSISGLHLALAGGFFFWLVRAVLALIPAVALNYPIKKWAAVAALGGASFYLMISGCDAPAVRSYIMLAIMFGAIIADRSALTMRNVALAAAVILAARPQSLTEPGFEMSFAAVIGLIALAEWQQARRARDEAPGWPTRVRRYWTDILLATLVASLATAPFALYHFDRSSQYGLLANLATIPLTGFIIMPAATAAMVLMPFGLDRLPLLVMGKGVAAMTWVAHVVAGLPNAASLAPVMPMSALLLLVLGGLWMALWRRRWRWLGLAPAALGVVLAVIATGPDIFIARDGVTVAVRTGDGLLHLIRKPRDKFSAAEWLKRDGDERDPLQAVASPADGVRCDAYGCIAVLRDGSLLAAAARIEALEEDCTRAAVVVSAVPASRHCAGPKLVVDRFDVARAGGYAIRLGVSPAVQTVEGERGRRPWSQAQYRRIRPTSLP
jgi:competence protein ComEC